MPLFYITVVQDLRSAPRFAGSYVSEAADIAGIKCPAEVGIPFDDDSEAVAYAIPDGEPESTFPRDVALTEDFLRQRGAKSNKEWRMQEQGIQ